MSVQNNNFQSYAGFTIGPIHDVLSHARKTRELWFGSYFFSWFMEKMVEKLMSDPKMIEFLVPYVEVPFKLNKSITGKYHDRFIIQSSLNKEDLFQKMQHATDESLKDFVDMISRLVSALAKITYLPDISNDSILTILRDYIQRNFVVFDSSVMNQEKVVKDMSKYLDSMEENRLFVTGQVKNTCFICKTLPSIVSARIYFTDNTTDKHDHEKLCPLCFLKYFCFKSEEVKKKIDDSNFRYPPVLDISAGELLTDDVRDTNPVLKDYERDYDFKDIEAGIEEVFSRKYVKERSKPYHKYLAILQADGDNLGRVLDKYKKPEEISLNFSKPLFDFADEAKRLIDSYRGQPIYIGGDDILAFVPVAFTDDDGSVKTVFDLSVGLTEKYMSIIDKTRGETTLSIGINIAYYKFPLSMALANTMEQLFIKAKAGNKNALAVLLTKHSGHQIGFRFTLGALEIKLFNGILKEVLAGSIQIPHSLHHNLSRFKKLIAHIPDERRLHAFFENNFNEPVHTIYSAGLDKVEDYFGKVMFCHPENRRYQCVEEILDKLAFIKFLRGKK